MCNQKKTAAFEYFVSKLVGLDLEKEKRKRRLRLIDLGKKKTLSKENDLNKKLSEYSMTRYMKLLYFLCLTDANQEEKGKEGAVPDDNLLKTFDNFEAYLNGPVEVDIYENRLYEGIFTLFTFEEGRLRLRKKRLARKAKKILKETSPEVRKAIGGALSDLRDKGSKIVPNKSILEQDTISLVELSHSLNSDVWPACFYYNKQGGSISQLFREDSSLLDAEVKEFEKNLIYIKG